MKTTHTIHTVWQSLRQNINIFPNACRSITFNTHQTLASLWSAILYIKTHEHTGDGRPSHRGNIYMGGDMAHYLIVFVIQTCRFIYIQISVIFAVICLPQEFTFLIMYFRRCAAEVFRNMDKI